MTISASAIEIYQDLAYDLLNDSSPLTVGTKGSGQTIVASNVAVQSNGTQLQAGIGGAHPAACNCRICMGIKLRCERRFCHPSARNLSEPASAAEARHFYLGMSEPASAAAWV